MAKYEIDPLLQAKRQQEVRVSVVLPARDEASTVGSIVSTLRQSWMGSVPLIDEIVVMDSDSTDDTSAVAEAAGARVVPVHSVLPHIGRPPGGGKGEALWTSLAATSGDLIVFVDADLVDIDPNFVPGLLGPLLSDPAIGFVKGMYDRPLTSSTGIQPTGGGRVTELLARPLLNAWWPELAGVVQPLGGEYAGRRTVLERLPFVSGYGVELGLLIDIARSNGVRSIAQVDLGTRQHRHQSDAALGRMAGQILQTAVSRLGGAAPAASTELLQFARTGSLVDATGWDVTVHDLLPMAMLRAEPITSDS